MLDMNAHGNGGDGISDTCPSFSCSVEEGKPIKKSEFLICFFGLHIIKSVASAYHSSNV